MVRAGFAPIVLVLLALLAACEGGQGTQRDAEVRALRERVERLERDATAERERLAQEAEALRRTLDEANRQLAGQPGKEDGNPASPGKTAPAGKSPRAALRQSFNEAVEASRQALERLNRSLDESLARSRSKEPAREPAREPAPAK